MACMRDSNLAGLPARSDTGWPGKWHGNSHPTMPACRTRVVCSQIWRTAVFQAVYCGQIVYSLLGNALSGGGSVTRLLKYGTVCYNSAHELATMLRLSVFSMASMCTGRAHMRCDAHCVEDEHSADVLQSHHRRMQQPHSPPTDQHNTMGACLQILPPAKLPHLSYVPCSRTPNQVDHGCWQIQFNAQNHAVYKSSVLSGCSSRTCCHM